jgi:hypothetical protein
MWVNHTIATTTDGFGAQYQRIIQTYIFCKLHNLNFLYKPFSVVEHNYDNDINYIDKIENLINLKNNITNINSSDIAKELDYGWDVRPFFESNIDLCCNSEYMKFIKHCYWSNKDKNFFNNNRFNVAIHIRRENCLDRGLAGDRANTPNSYYLNVMNHISEKYKDKNLLFHIYSQGEIDNFREFENTNVKFYLNYDVFESFKGMVSSDVLVISPSSFSYVAALISDAEIYYKNFWHNPKKEWIIMS